MHLDDQPQSGTDFAAANGIGNVLNGIFRFASENSTREKNDRIKSLPLRNRLLAVPAALVCRTEPPSRNLAGGKLTEGAMKLFVAALGGMACCLLIDPAMSAERCVSRSDAMALKAAAVQQQLMVAAFMCRDANAYNRFVRTYQADLQDSDASLKSYFVRRLGRRGEAAYDSYKTKVANLSALSQARNSGAFCGAADRLFEQAQESRASLSSFVEDAPSPPGFRSLCVSAPAVVSARKPLHMAQARPAGSR